MRYDNRKHSQLFGCRIGKRRRPADTLEYPPGADHAVAAGGPNRQQLDWAVLASPCGTPGGSHGGRGD